MSFTHPLIAIVALVALPLYSILHRLRQRLGRDAAYAYSSLPYLSAALGPSQLPLAMRDCINVAGIALLIAAGGGPHTVIAAPLDAATVIFCIDTSGSMKTADMQGTRAAAATKALERFMAAIPAKIRVGLISFSGSAQIISMPATDARRLRRKIDSIPAPNGQTAIGDALRLAEQIMPKTGRRTIVLITDGVNNRGGAPAEEVERLRRSGIALDTIGDGRSGYNERDLRTFAQTANGRYAAIADGSAFATTLQTMALSATRDFHRVDLSALATTMGCIFLGLAWLLGITAGRFPFLGEPETREQLGHPDDTPSLRCAGRYGDWRRSHRGAAHVD